MSLIQVQNLAKTFTSSAGAQTHALRDVSFSIKENEYVAIMGQSGSGKSTLLHILGLLITPTSGQYILNGQNINDLSEEDRAHLRNSSLGFVFQAFHLLARATVLENVLLPLAYSKTALGWSSQKRQQKALAALDQVELGHRTRHTPAQLSGGEKQRVAIARALVLEPQVIFADEPTGNLDSKTGATVMRLFENLHQADHTIIVITHETITADYAQRIITLHDGQIQSDQKHESKYQHYSK